MLKSLAALVTALLLAGCTTAPVASSASSASPTRSVATADTSPTSSPSVTPVPSPSATVQLVEISLKDGKATPNGDRLTLAKGTVLRLQITADHADEVHVHGYDVEIAVKAGATVTKNITLDQVGRFEIESHEPALTIIQLVVS